MPHLSFRELEVGLVRKGVGELGRTAGGLWREGRTGLELAALLRHPDFRRPAPHVGWGRPVLLVPGVLAGDESLGVLAGWLRRSGFAPGGAGMRLNAGCFTAALDALEERA